MGRIDHFAQLVARAHVGVHRRVVERPVAVVGVMLELLLAAHHPAVYLFVRRRDPQGVDAQFPEIAGFELLRDAADVAAMEAADVPALRVGGAAITVVIAGIAVGETVRHGEVDDGIIREAARLRRQADEQSGEGGQHGLHVSPSRRQPSGRRSSIFAPAGTRP
ncbi:hypothetical protein D3C72_1754300 [compost metagenome]